MYYLFGFISLLSWYLCVTINSVNTHVSNTTHIYMETDHDRPINSAVDVLNGKSGRLHANFNDYIDGTCWLMSRNQKLDMVKLLNRTSNSFLLKKTYYNGELEGLRTITRKGQCFVNYEIKLLLIVTKLNFKEFTVTYNLLAKLLFLEMKFKVSLIMKDADIETAVLTDADRFQFTMDRVVIPHVRKLRIKIQGESIFGWILDKILAVVTFIFKTQVIHHIEKRMVDSIQNQFDHLPFFNKTAPIHVSPYCIDNYITSFISRV